MRNNIGMFMKVLTLYIGTVIGAGFASGQEILQFFISYGSMGLWGVLITTVLFSYLGMVIMYLSVELKSGNYQQLLPYLMGPGAKLMDYLSLTMLVGGLAIMLAGSGAVLEQYFGVPNYVGVGVALIVTAIVLCGGVERVLSASLLLVPLKLVAVVLISIIAIYGQPIDHTITSVPEKQPMVASHWLWASILYVSYNMVVPLAALSSLGRMVTSNVGVLAGLLGGLILGGAIALVSVAGLSNYPEITNYPVPMLYMASTMGSLWKTIFALLIWVAIVTTAIANAHGFASRIASNGGRLYKLVGVGICLLVLPLAKLDFPKLVQTLYPMFGYAGLILMAALLVMPIIKLKNSNRY